MKHVEFITLLCFRILRKLGAKYLYMKLAYFIRLILIIQSCILFSCNNTDGIESSVNNDLLPSNDTTWLDFDPYRSSLHEVSLQCGAEYIPVRKIKLSNQELINSNSGSFDGKILNDSSIMAYLYNGHLVELIEEEGIFYRINFEYNNQSYSGYIIKSFCGKTTLVKSNAGRYLKKISNHPLKPYCRILVSKKFSDILKECKDTNDPLNCFKKAIDQTLTQLLIHSLFVGESRRHLVKNYSRAGGDNSDSIYRVDVDYYTYDFGNFSNMFVATNPNRPLKIKTYNIIDDTIYYSRYSGVLFDELGNVKRRIQTQKIFPKYGKRAFSNINRDVWILNDSIEMLDISFLANKFEIRETQIGHFYYYEILDQYIQEILPKRNQGYLNEWLSLKIEYSSVN